MGAICMPVSHKLSWKTLQKDYPQFVFQNASVFCWVYETQSIQFNPAILEFDEGIYQLFHELGHALCGHKMFTSGIELLKIEVEAWEKAKQIGKKYSIDINQDHIEKCLDTYRDWLHLRSTCPMCSVIATELDVCRYKCFNCGQQWQTPADQRSRCYRKKIVKI